MHLLATFTPPDYTAWKADFDAHWEARDQAGLTLLQLWRGADDTSRVVALFEVADRPRAQAWLDRQSALHGGIAAQFVRTA
jgi:hypothetical protein